MNEKLVKIAASVGQEDVYIQLTVDKFVKLIENIKKEIAEECSELLDEKDRKKKAAYWEAYSHGVNAAIDRINNFGDTDQWRSSTNEKS
jgi:phosphopantetheine adenylyltransferase